MQGNQEDFDDIDEGIIEKQNHEMDSEDEENKQIGDLEENNDQDDQDEEESHALQAGGDQIANMAAFTRKYGVQMEIPGYYTQNAKIYPGQSEYYVQTVSFVLPQESKYVRTFDEEGNCVPDQPIDQVFTHEKYQWASLKLMRNNNGVLEEIGEEIPLLESKKVNIEFSPDGKYFAVLHKKRNLLDVWEVEDNDIVALFEKIKDGQEEPFLRIDENPAFRKTKNLEFDSMSKYLVCFGLKSMNIINLEDTDAEIKNWSVNPDCFRAILDVQLVSNDEDENGYRCDVACRVDGEKSILLFGIEEDQETAKEQAVRSIKYLSNDSSTIQVKISEDFTKAVLVNKTENYLLSMGQDGLYHQSSLGWLKGKTVRSINSSYNHFIFVSCKDYDRDLDIMCSSNGSFKISIPRNIEPGIIDALDVFQEEPNEEGFGIKMQILSTRDQQFFVDTIYPQEEEDQVAKSLMFQKYRGISVNWPYISFQGIESNENYVWILDAFKPRFINRVLLPSDIKQIVQTFICESYDLYVVGEYESSYQMFHIDLDNFADEQRKQQVFVAVPSMDPYSKDTIDEKNSPLIGFHVRSSSSKKNKLNRSKKLYAFFLHQGSLWYFKGGNNEIKKVQDTKCNQLYRLDDDNIIFRYDEQNMFKLLQINIEFSNYSIDTLYQEDTSFYSIKAFGFDYLDGILILMKVPKNRSKQKIKTCKIYDLNNSKILWQSQIKKTELIGRLKSSLYTLVGGHMYFNNNIIKIRYDLLRKKNLKDLEEYEVFDFYENILALESNETIITKMPTCSLKYHRLVYFSKNKKDLRPNKVTILPFLHERKIILSRNKQEGGEYFYNTIKRQQTLFIRMCLSEQKYYVYNQKGILKKRVDYRQKVVAFGKPIAVSNNGLFVLFKPQRTPFVHILALNPESLNFTFMKSVNIETAILAYISTFLSCAIENEHEVNRIQQIQEFFENNFQGQFGSNNLIYQINDQMDIIVKITKKVEDEKNKKFLKSRKNNQEKTFEEKVKEMFKDQMGMLFYYQKGCVGFKKSEESEQVLRDMGINYYQFYSEEIGEVFKQTCFVTKRLSELEEGEELTYTEKIFESGLNGFSINNDYLFFWNGFKIWYLDTNAIENGFTFIELGLLVSANEEQTMIRKVRTGSSSNEIIIQVRQSATSDCAITWSISKNREIESFDLGLDSKIFWDSNGAPYITEDQKVYVTKQGVALLCYDVVNVNKSDSYVPKFGYHFGHRFDTDEHSWLYLNEYISLSYSYMTFVIKNKIHTEDEDYEQKDYLFDLEQYNYVIGRRTALTDSNILEDNHELLAFILKNFENINPDLLSQIQYYHYKIDEKTGKKAPETPLHMALQSRNNRSVRILLQYMAKIPFNASETYKDIFQDLIDFTGFTDYLWELEFQTTQMLNKQTMRVENPFSSKIVKMGSSLTSYVDGEYYKKKFQEQDISEFKSYPVKVVALKINWVLSKEGEQYLQAVLRSENLDIYLIPAMQMIIEYLYSKYKKAIIRNILPVYIFQLVSFFATMYMNEHQFQVGSVLKTEKNEEGEEVEVSYIILERRKDYNSRPTMFANTISMAISIVIIGRYMINAYKKKETINDRALLDIGFSVLNVIISIGIFSNVQSGDGFDPRDGSHFLRVIQAFAAIAIWSKSLYFLQVFDVMAPLVHIIKKVFYDIGYFVMIMIIVMCAFGNAFYLMGKNQVQFDQIDDGEEPIYSTMYGAMKYIYLMCLGEIFADDSNFDKGEKSQKIYLWFLFILATFVIIVTMMNMLIAIMGDTFTNNSEIAEQNTNKEHLRFVMDHWYMRPIDEEINYLIAAFLIEEVDEDVEILEELHEDVKNMRKANAEDMDIIMSYIKQIKSQIDSKKN